jgi:hypothetical protein
MTPKHCFSIFRRLPAILCLCSTALFVAASHADDAARWYKGNTHAHSFWSDGDEFPEMVADWYNSHGYDFLALSDHDRLMAGEKWAPVDHGKRFVPSSVLEKCKQRFGADWLTLREQDGNRQVKLKTFDEVCAKLMEPGKFLLIQNEEISAKVDDHHVHLNAVNLAEAIAPKVGQNVLETLSLNLATVRQQAERLGRPILAHVNHPNWSDYDVAPEDVAAVATAGFFEVCNGGTGIHNFGDATHPGTEKFWDIANTIRIAKMHAPPLYGIAADDAHNYQQFAPTRANPGRAWIVVRAKQLGAESLLEAMNRGDFYASTGVTLRNFAYDAKGRTLAVEVQPESGVRYTIEFIGALEGADPTGQPIEVAAGNGQKPKRPGRRYSPEVGKVLSSVPNTSATYQFTGKELYVRAAVRSDKPITNAPAGEAQTQEAWCQPVGWER